MDKRSDRQHVFARQHNWLTQCIFVLIPIALKNPQSLRTLQGLQDASCLSLPCISLSICMWPEPQSREAHSGNQVVACTTRINSNKTPYFSLKCVLWLLRWRCMMRRTRPSTHHPGEHFIRNMRVHLPLPANLNKYIFIPPSTPLHPCNPFCISWLVTYLPEPS